MMKRTSKKGFTIVELLTVMGVIAVLIGLLVPALGLVKDYAKNIQQRAQFHSIDVGLEIYKNEFGAYPESLDNSYELTPPAWKDNTVYCGANKLAEAMIGWDFLGFHPKSGFTANGEKNIDGDTAAELIYDTDTGIRSSSGLAAYDELNGAENIANRVKFIDLENANGFQMRDIYTNNLGSFTPESVVLSDVYAKKRQSGKKAGMPILYYRARTGLQFQDWDDTLGIEDDIYNFEDNIELLDLNSPDDVSIPHPLLDGTGDYQDFEEMIVNQQVLQATTNTANPDGIKRPYRADTFILISAGKDGLYGTADDVLNFDKEIIE
jgi:prepilin-type N-terminal cleavage/methylation domain-containing protein